MDCFPDQAQTAAAREFFASDDARRQKGSRGVAGAKRGGSLSIRGKRKNPSSQPLGSIGRWLVFLLLSLVMTPPWLSKVAVFTGAAPYLDSFDVDMTYGTLTLEFSETMHGKTLDASQIVVQNNRTRACNPKARSDCGTNSYRRLTGAYTVPRYNSSTITLILNEKDLLGILFYSNLYTGLSNTYLAMNTSTIKSIYNEENSVINDGHAMQASTFTADSFKPVFQKFHFDMDSGMMMLEFNEPVNASSFRPAGISIQEKSNINKGGEQYTLLKEGVEVIDPNVTKTFINISLGFTNLNLIRAAYPLCSAAAYCHMGFTIDNLIRDIAGNPMSLLDTVYSAVTPKSYVIDTTRPQLDYFALDLDGGLLSLYFTETVDAYEFTVGEITLQNKKQVVDTSVPGNQSIGLSYTFTSATTKSTSNSWVMYLYIGDDDLNNIKLMYKLGTSKDSTFVTFSEKLVMDMAEFSNVVVPSRDGSAAQATYYSADNTGPQIIDFSIDLNMRTLTLTFSEVVNASTSDAAGITIQNAQTASLSTTFSSQSKTSSDNGLTLKFDIADKDFNGVKELAGLGEKRANTFITASSITVGDMMGFETNTNYLQPITDGTSGVLYATNFTADQQPPSVVGFDLDLDSKAQANLTITFSEPIDTSTLDVTKITLFGSDENEGTAIPLTAENSMSTSPDGTEIKVQLTGADLKSIKLSDDIGTGSSYHCTLQEEPVDDDSSYKCYWMNYNDALLESSSPVQNVWLTIDDGAAQDTFTYGTDGQPVQNDLIGVAYDDVMGVLNFTQDGTKPNLLSFDLDMDSNMLSLYFDEPVRVHTLNVTYLTIMQAYDGNHTHQLTFDEYYGSESLSDNDDFLDIAFGEIDSDAIKLAQFLAIDAKSTWLRIMPDTIQDMAGNGLFVQNWTWSVPVTSYTADSTGPQILSFDFDNTKGVFTLRFSEPIRMDTFDPSALTVQSQEKVGKTTFVGLSNDDDWATYGSQDTRTLNLTISKTDLSEIKADSSLGTSQSDTYLRTTTALVRDMAIQKNKNVQILDGYALNVGPVLLSYTLDMDSGEVSLFFSEAVDSANNLDATGITFQQSEDIEDGDEFLTLTGADDVKSSPDNRFVFFKLTDDDFDGLRILNTAAQSKAATFIVLDSSAVLDLSTTDRGNNIGPNDVLPIVDGSTAPSWEIPFAPLFYTLDTTRPFLREFDLDMDSGTLTMLFSEPLRTSKMQVDQITFQSERVFVGNQTKSVTLTKNSTTSSSDARIVEVDLQQKGGDDSQDLDLLKIVKGLCSSADDTFISFSRFLATDSATALNKLIPVVNTNATQVSTFKDDTTKPSLQSFDLDMNQGLLTLVFDEAVNASIFDVTQITIQAASDDATYYHTLSSDCPVLNKAAGGLAVIYIGLPKLETRRLSKINEVATSVDDTYMTITADATTDIGTKYQDQNVLLAVETSSGGVLEVGAMQVTTYTRDSTPPNLLNFSLDMDSGLVVLEFDEVVDKSSLDPTAITLQYDSYAGSSTNLYQILNATNDVANVNSLFLKFTLGLTDMNSIKALTGLAISPETAYLRSTSSLAMDTAGNAMARIADGSALLATEYVPDTTRPECTAYVLQDNGYLIMQFSETIDYTAFNASSVRISDGASSSLSYMLTDEESVVYDGAYDTSLKIQLNEDFTNINNLGLGVSQLTSYLSFNKGFIGDTAGNKIRGVPVTDPMLMGPSLISFDMDMDEGTMKLYFSEPVMGTATSWKPDNYTFDPTALNFINGLANYTLSQYSAATTKKGKTINLELALNDVENIKLKRTLAVSSASASVYIPAGSELSVNNNEKAVDAPNAVVPISVSSPLAVSTFTADTTEPQLDHYVLDKDEGLMYLYFTEPINGNVTIPLITLQSSQLLETGDTSFSLTQGSKLLKYSDSKNLTVSFSKQDLNNIQALRVGAFIAMGARFTKDLANPANYLTPIVDGSAQAVFRTIYDTTPPELVSFSIDMGEGYIYLNFSEPIETSALNVTAIRLVDSRNGTKAGAIALTGDTVTYDGAGTEITLNMNLKPTDLNILKLDATVCKDADSAFMLIDPNAVIDMAEYPNPIARIADGNALKAKEFIRDTKRPTLQSFDLDINPKSPKYRYLSLFFDEPMDASEVDVTAMKIQNGTRLNQLKTGATASTDARNYGDVYSVALNASVQPTTDGNSIDILLTNDVVNRLTHLTGADQGGNVIGMHTHFALENKTFLVAPAKSAVDMFFNPMNPHNSTDALRMGPVLNSFTLDMDSGELNMMFSEPVNRSDFAVDGLTFVGLTTSAYYTLADQNQTRFVSKSGGANIIMSMSDKDMNSIKLVDNLGTLSTTSKVSVSTRMCHNKAFDPTAIQQILPEEAMSAAVFTKDLTSPKLISIKFDLDAGDGYFFLKFDEPVQADAIVIEHITIQNRSRVVSDGINVQSYTLTGASGTAVTTETGTEHTITIGYDDSAAIKILAELATSLASTFFSIKTKTFFDTSYDENTASTISATNARQVIEYTPDTTDPFLKYFDIDMDSGELTLYFNEPVDTSSLKVNFISVQAMGLRIDGESHRLTNGSYTPTSDADTIVVVLSDFDYKTINDNEFLATGTTDTFVTFPAKTITDMAGNNVVEVQDGLAMAVTTYNPDVTAPTLDEFDLDMDSGILTLMFSEAVLGSSFDAPGFTLQSMTKLAGTSGVDYQTFRLTDETTDRFQQNNSETIYVRLADDDLNNIKYNELLAVSANSSCLSVKATAVTDMSGNNIIAISSGAALTCNGDNVGYIYDTTQPVAQTFDLDMNTGVMTLTFSESMDSGAGKTTPSFITMQQFSATSAGERFTLTGGYYASGTDEQSAIFYFTITDDDLNNIKATKIGSLDTYTWMTMKENAFKDVSVDYFYRTPRGSVLLAGSDAAGGTPLQVSTLTKDTTAPTLNKFVVSTSDKLLYLFFSEAVDLSTFDPTAIYVQNIAGQVDNLGRNGDNQTFSLPLTSTTTGTYGRDFTEIILDLGGTCATTTDCSLSGCVTYTSTTCDWHTLDVAFQASSYEQAFYLVITSDMISDFANPANDVEAVGTLISDKRRLEELSGRRLSSDSAQGQSFPYCGPCLSGTEVTECTDVYDQVCGPCSNCTTGYYKSASCTPYLDTECSECSECDYGFYISEQCNSEGTDTVCSECTICTEEEYEINQCTAGANTLCGSCFTCYYASDLQRIGCRGSPKWWQQENCCWDRDDNQVKCKLTELEDFRIDARDSHRHWVWDRTYPTVPEGYEQGIWAGAID